LRAVAILLVLWHHAPVILRAPLALYNGTFWRMSGSGWMGVDLFFVLSGFLITGILLRSRGATRQLRAFWARRALRIFPVAFVYLGALYFLARVLGWPPLLARFHRFAPYVLYVGNLDIAFNGWVDATLAILWSLAIEEQFYAVWPLLGRVLKPRVWLIVCAAIACGAPLARWWTWARYGQVATYVSTWCRIDNLAIGAALAIGYHDAALRPYFARACRWLAIPALVGVALAIAEPFGMLYPAHNPEWFALFGYSGIAIGFAVLIGLAADAPRGAHPILNNRVLRYIGRISYGIYLWHVLCGYLVDQFIAPRLGLGLSMKMIVWLALVLAWASLSWFAFEKPILAFKARFQLEGRQLGSSAQLAG
jgi:peptidoglycan/LPS O-acetylase OafA/YrhL